MISPKDIHDQALALGWDDVGITTPEIPQEDIDAYYSWREHNYHADMHYMENDLRCYPKDLFPGAKTAIIFITYYKQPHCPFRADAGLVASYARGKKYHNIHHKRLKKFIHWLEQKSGLSNIAKGFSDSAPIIEKALAAKAGLGWIGKNTLLIHPKFGTFTLLSGVLTTLEIPAPPPTIRRPRCGSCQRCLDNCPTGALCEPYTLDARRCLSYHLIESKKKIPPEISKKNSGYIFGCDICQEVCPHNKRTPLSCQEDFDPNKGVGPYVSMNDINHWEKQPEDLFGTPLQRQGVERLKYTAKTLNL